MASTSIPVTEADSIKVVIKPKLNTAIEVKDADWVIEGTVFVD